MLCPPGIPQRITMETLEEVEDLSTVTGSVIVKIRGGSRGFVEGVVRAVHEGTREISVRVPSLNESFDFQDHEVWDGSWVWIAFSGRSPMKAFVGHEDVAESLRNDFYDLRCFAFDAEGMLHLASLTVRSGAVDYILAPSP